MSARNNGVSLKLIGIFVFLALTMNCLSLVSGAATDNKGAEVDCPGTCYYKMTSPMAYEGSPPCACGVCSETDPNGMYTMDYYNDCTKENAIAGSYCSGSGTAFGMPVTLDGQCEDIGYLNGLCCHLSGKIMGFDANGIICSC